MLSTSLTIKQKNILKSHEKIKRFFKPYFLEFEKSTKNLQKVQRLRLKSILKKNRNCLIGQKYSFGKIRNTKDFQNLFPITDYSFYDSYIGKYVSSRSRILSGEKIEIFEETSGSTSKQKLIPYTAGLHKEFLNGLAAWVYDLYSNNPEVTKGKSYWSLTPPLYRSRKHSSGIKIGFNSDEEYFGVKARKEINKIMAVPTWINSIANFNDFRYISQLFLSLTPELSFISIWNPTFLEVLFQDYRKNLPNIIKDIENRSISHCECDLDSNIKQVITQAISLKKFHLSNLRKVAAIKDNTKFFSYLFPNLKMISCWTHANSKLYIGAVKKTFPHVKIQSKGLIATEYLASIPISGVSDPVLVPNAHFYEFAEMINGKPEFNNIYTAELLEKNKQYLLIVTTSGGFYRYNTGDIVKVKGYYNQSPTIEFLGKLDNVSDIVGEKINADSIEQIYLALRKEGVSSLKFFMVAPEIKKGYSRYVIYLQSKDPKEKLMKFRDQFEKKMSDNLYYNLARRSGQLKSLGIFKIKKNAQESYITRCTRLGQRVGNIKNNILNKNTDWEKFFIGQYLD